MSGNKFLLETNTILYLLGGKLNPKDLLGEKLIISFMCLVNKNELYITCQKLSFVQE